MGGRRQLRGRGGDDGVRAREAVVQEIAKMDVSLDLSGAAVEDGLDATELAKVASGVAAASGAKSSEVKVMGVNYTMTTTVTLSGFAAAAVDAAMKQKLSDAFATATGAPKAATRVDSVKDVAAAAAARRRRLLQAGVEVAYVVESTDAAVVKSASDKAKGGGGGGGGASGNSTTFAATLASGLKSAGVSATVQSTSTPQMKAKIIVKVVAADAAVAEKLTSGKVTATDISTAMTNAGLAGAKATGMTTKKTMIAAPSPPPLADEDDDVIISAFGIDADLTMLAAAGGGVLVLLASCVVCIRRRCCCRGRRGTDSTDYVKDVDAKKGDSRTPYNGGAANGARTSNRPSSPPYPSGSEWGEGKRAHVLHGRSEGGGGEAGEEKVYEVRNPYASGGSNKGNVRVDSKKRTGMTRVNRVDGGY